MIADAAAFRLLVRNPGRTAPHRTPGEPIHICSLVFDPDEDLAGPATELSAFGKSVASARARLRFEEAERQLTYAHQLITDGVVQVVEMTEGELRLWHKVMHEAKDHCPLGMAPSAAATVALSQSRTWAVLSGDIDVIRYLEATGGLAIRLD